MADWTYLPRPRFDSQGPPQSPFQQGTAVGNADHGVCWTRLITDPAAIPPDILVSVGQKEGYVLDNTAGDMYDDLGNHTPNAAFPGGTVTSVSIGSSPAIFSVTTGIIQYFYYMRRRSDGVTFTLYSVDAGGTGHPCAGFPTLTTNPFTALPWVASELMGSAATYDFYFDFIAGSVTTTVDFYIFDSGFFQVQFTPSVVTPAVLAVVPSTGTVDGGQAVTIRGRGFTAQTGVTFCGVAATSVVLLNDSTITAVTPAHASGACDVAVLSVATGTALYTYVIPPSFTLPPLPGRTPIMQGGGKRGR